MRALNLYILASFDRFEDWYVEFNGETEFDNLLDAVSSLIEECSEIILDKNSTNHIDEYITDELKPDNFEEEYGDCSKGFTRNILINDRELISISINYEYTSKKKYFENVVVEQEKLDITSLDQLNKFLKSHKYEL